MNSFYIFNCFSDSVYFYGKICYINLNLDIFDDLYCLILFRILFIDFNKLIIYVYFIIKKIRINLWFFKNFNRLYKVIKYRENK